MTKSTPKRAAEWFVFALAGALIPVAAGSAWVAGTPILPAIGLAAAFFALGYGLKLLVPSLAQVGPAIAAVGQPIVITGALAGHPWQLDAHMLFFAMIAVLVSLKSVWAILVGAALVAVHHLTLTFLLPALVYPTTELLVNVQRTLIHAVVVVIQTAALVAAVVARNRLDAETLQQNAQLRDSAEAAEHERKAAQEAKDNALASEEQSKAALQEAERAKSEALGAFEEQQKAMAAMAEAEKRANDQQALVETKAEEAVAALRDAQTARDQARTQEAKVAQEVAEHAQAQAAMRDALAALEQGNLAVRLADDVGPQYEDLRQAFNAAVSSLDSMFQEMAAHADEIETHTGEISNSAGALATRTETQAETLSQTNLALQAVSTAIAEASAVAEAANSSVQRANDSGDQCQTTVQGAAESMKNIETGSSQISEIVEVIDGISFQTSLLALNAGVEAARAGEAGRGFAVVASEVRALAQRSSESATNIRDLIARSNKEVSQGSTRFGDSVDALGTMLREVQSIANQVDGIATSTHKQSEHLGQVASAMSDLETTTQQNAAMGEETKAACMMVSQSVASLRERLSKFVCSSGKLQDAA